MKTCTYRSTGLTDHELECARDQGPTDHELETWVRDLGPTDDHELEAWARDVGLTDHVSETCTGISTAPPYRSSMSETYGCIGLYRPPLQIHRGHYHTTVWIILGVVLNRHGRSGHYVSENKSHHQHTVAA